MMIEQTVPAPATTPTAPFTILFATDGSPVAEKAFEEAVSLAYHSKGRLILTFYADPQDSAIYGGQPCNTDEQWQAYGRQVLDRLAARAKAAGVAQVETILEHYQDEESLYQLGSEIGANLTTLASYCFRFS